MTTRTKARENPARRAENLRAENAELRARVAELEEVLRAIQAGEVDALVTTGPAGERVFTLKGADHAYRVLVEQMNEAAATLSSDGTILYANARLGNMLAVSLENVTGASFRDFVAPKDHARFDALLALGRAQDSRGEIALCTPEGTATPALLSLRAWDNEGTSAISLIASDLTEQKASEEQIRSLNADLERRVAERTVSLELAMDSLENRTEELQTLVDSIADEVWLCDATGKVKLTNPAAVLGLGFDHAMQRPLLEIIDELEILHPDGSPRPPEDAPPLRSLRTGEVVQGEEIIRHRKTGEQRHRQYHAAPIRDHAGHIVGAVTVVRDISELKAAELQTMRLNAELEHQAIELEHQAVELESANARLLELLDRERAARAEAEEAARILESIMEFAPEGITIVDARGTTRMVSRYASELAGLAREALEKAPIEERPVKLGFRRPADLTTPAPEELPVVRAIRQGERVENEEWAIARPDGEQVLVQSSAGPIRDSEGRITGAIATWRDVTEQKRIQAGIEALNRRLERHSTELEIANRELEAFSYSVSHDLRAPLASIHGFAQLLLNDHQPNLPSDAQRFIRLIVENARAMERLIQDLLGLSRAGRLPLKKETVDMTMMARQVLEELRGAQIGRQVKVQVGDMPPCQADPGLLKQVYANLISNAFKFTRKREEAHIEIGSRPCEDTDPVQGPAVYYVKDDGVGFDMEESDGLFGVFRRFHSEEEYEGTGVGLAIVDRILRRHGGCIWAEAHVNQGAAFYFVLPNPGSMPREAPC